MNPFANVSIVAPIDFTDEADFAVDFALQLAGRPECVHAMHVCPPLMLYEPAAVFNIRRDETCEQRQAVFRQRYADPKYNGIQFDVRFGDPADEIVDYAEQIGAGLIVIPSHARTGFAHLLVSSVAERVVRHAPCPVLALRV